LQNRERKGSSRGTERETVEQATEDPILSTVMDVRIVTVEIAQAGLKAIVLGLQYEELMRLPSGQGICDPQLERHIEPGHTKGSGKTHTAEIVDGGPTTCNEGIDTIQAVLPSTGDLKHAMRLVTESRQPTNKSGEEA
jgi:hypothetical protein